jgi:siderophore synthetase component
MATDPEALAQLSRLLGEPPGASETDLLRVLADRLDQLAGGIVNEAAASDDVFDKASALEFVAARLRDFERYLSVEQARLVTEEAGRRIEAW